LVFVLCASSMWNDAMQRVMMSNVSVCENARDAVWMLIERIIININVRWTYLWREWIKRITPFMVIYLKKKKPMQIKYCSWRFKIGSKRKKIDWLYLCYLFKYNFCCKVQAIKQCLRSVTHSEYEYESHEDWNISIFFRFTNIIAAQTLDIDLIIMTTRTIYVLYTYKTVKWSFLLVSLVKNVK
jgi:hypothetical protein